MHEKDCSYLGDRDILEQLCGDAGPLGAVVDDG